MKLSLAGYAVLWTMNTSWPRTLSSTRTKRFPSVKRITSALPSSTPRYAAIALPSRWLADPAKIKNSLSTPLTIPLRGLRTRSRNSLGRPVRVFALPRKRYTATVTHSPTSSEPQISRRAASLRFPGLLLGLGLGGFVDGIVLHQILQWHHLISQETPPTDLGNLQANVTADGLFHATTWLLVVAGLAALWTTVRSGRPWTWRHLVGWMLAGWGIFNLVEGVVDHHLLQIHRVRPNTADPLAWDIGFLVLGALLLVGGWLLARAAPPSSTETSTG